MMDSKNQHQNYNPLDYSDKQVTLCDGRTVSLSQYRREIEESSNNKQLQQDQPCSSSQSSSQESKGETRIIRVEIAFPNGDQRYLTCKVRLGPMCEIINRILEKIDVPIAGRNFKYKETGPNSYLVKFVPQEFAFRIPQPWRRNIKIAPGFAVCPNCRVCTVADLLRCVRYDLAEKLFIDSIRLTCIPFLVLFQMSTSFRQQQGLLSLQLIKILIETATLI